MGIVERRIRERQQRIEEILNAAKNVFLSKGFALTTMNDIADKSDLSRRTLYHYFRSKEEVSLAAAEMTLERLLLDIQDRVSREKTGMNKLLVMLKSYRTMFETEPGNFQYIVNFPNIARAIDKDNDSLKQCLATIRELTDLVGDFLEEGTNDGTIRRIEADQKNAAVVLVSMVNSIMQNAVSYKNVVRMATGLDSSVFLEEAFSYLRYFLSPLSC